MEVDPVTLLVGLAYNDDDFDVEDLMDSIGAYNITGKADELFMKVLHLWCDGAGFKPEQEPLVMSTLFPLRMYQSYIDMRHSWDLSDAYF